MIGASCWRVRGRLPGDRICLPGGSKTLKRLMIDRRVPRHLRHRLPVLLCDGTVAGVPGLAADLRFRPEGEGPALVVEYHPAEESRPLGGYEGEVL